MDWFEILTQVVGYIGLCACLLSFLFKKRSHIMAMQICGSLLFSIQLFMLEAWTGAILDVIAFIRMFIFSKKDTKNGHKHHSGLFSSFAL